MYVAGGAHWAAAAGEEMGGPPAQPLDLAHDSVSMGADGAVAARPVAGGVPARPRGTP